MIGNKNIAGEIVMLSSAKFKSAFKAAFPHTIPIFAGFAEFVAVNMLQGVFNPL